MQYIINENTLYLEKNNNLDQLHICETCSEKYLNCKLINIIDESCLKYGSNYKGRKEYSKKNLNTISKLPIIIRENPILIFFPMNNKISFDNLWISFNNIVTYKKINKQVEIVFINNIKKVIDYSYYSFHNQYLKCCNLYAMFHLKNIELSFKSSNFVL